MRLSHGLVAILLVVLLTGLPALAGDDCGTQLLPLEAAFHGSPLMARQSEGPPPPKGPNYFFVYSNEFHPRNALPILKRFPDGFYLTVGTERGWDLGALAQTRGIAFADSEPWVNEYNLVNRMLIKASRGSRAQYLNLRLRASRDEWTAAVGSERGFAFWSEVIRNPSGVIKSAPDIFRDGANYRTEYLTDDTLFEHLYRLVESDNVVVLKMDLASTSDLDALGEVVKRHRLSLSAIDLSNAWSEQFIGQKNMPPLIAQYASIGGEDTILFLTCRAGERTPASPAPFGYFGFTLGSFSDFTHSTFRQKLNAVLKSSEDRKWLLIKDGYAGSLNGVPPQRLVDTKGPAAEP